VTGGPRENGAMPVPPSRRARQRGLVGYRDRAQRTHFGLSPRFGVVHLTADALFDCVLHQRLLSLGEPGFLLLSLVFDGVVGPECMEPAWHALPTAYRCADSVCLDWLDRDGRLQRRLLGPLSVLALGACKHRGSFDAASSQLVAALSAQDAFGPDLNAVLSIVRARMATALAGDLLAHVIGDHPLSAVPRSSLARLHTKLALVSRSRQVTEDAGLDNGVRWRVADAAFSVAHAEDPEEASSLLRAIGNACRADSTEPNPAADRRRMSRQLEALAPACIAVGGWVCVLWSWTVDLVGRGTHRTQPLSPHSIDPYVALTLRELYRRVRDLPLDDASDIDWMGLYAEIEKTPSILPTQRGKAAAALTAWHEFLVEHLGVSPVDRPLDAEGDAPLPKANIVWPHEQAWMQRHLEARAGYGRFDAQLATVAAVICAAAMRSQDIWHIHMFGVHVGVGVVALNVDPLPSAGQGKSRNARRVVEIASGPVCTVLGAWVERRLAEGALDSDLLFGDPVDPGVPYRRGSTEASLNAWLKAATGDSSVSIHTLRHSFVSLARAGDRGNDQRSLDESSAQAGHGSTQMSMDHYCHRYEPVLRRSLDYWQRTHLLTEAQVCALTGLRPGCLRQRWHRHGDSCRLALAWDALAQGAAAVRLPCVTDGIAVDEPQPIALQAKAARTAGSVLAWLHELSADVPDGVVKLRHEISSDGWRAFEATIRTWCLRNRRRSIPGATRTSSRSGIPFASGFSRLAQPKLRGLTAHLRDTTNSAALAPVVQSWLDNLRGACLTLEEPNPMLPLLRWMFSGGIKGTQIVVCHDGRSPEAATDAADMAELVFGAAPTMRREGIRAGRPSVYLMLRAFDEPSNARANAATSVLGLHALLFSAWVWLQMQARGQGHG